MPRATSRFGRQFRRPTPRAALIRSSFPLAHSCWQSVGVNEDNDATGDLDINSNLTIKGKSSAKTIIDADDNDRVFQVLSGKVSISGVTIQHGLADGNGGGILNSGGQLKLSSVTIQDNQASGNQGQLGGNGANGVTVGGDGFIAGGNGGNGTAGSNGQGGGIFNAAGQA